jgi:hypothetical protein
MIVVVVIQAVLLSVLVFAWHRQRAQLAWVDERDKLLAPFMTVVQNIISLNVPIHGVDDVDGVRVGGKLIPSKVGIEQMILVWDQVSTALSFQRNEISAIGSMYGRLKNWEAGHPVPGPRWVCWPYRAHTPAREIIVMEQEP